MKKNLVTWILSSLGALSIAFSIIVMVPGMAKAAEITVPCEHGPAVKCTGTTCTGTDNVGCQCVNGSTATCPVDDGPPPEDPPQN